MKRYFGYGLPYIEISDLKGKLIVVEGSDGVGRSVQIYALRSWLELQGYGVAETGWTRSQLMSQTIHLAKEGHNMNIHTFNLLYATDFADRLEHEIIPALRAGFVVLADRYIYTAFARASVRGADMKWMRKLFGFAIIPDLVLYLKAGVETLVHRRLLSGSMDYWEAGLDQNPGLDPYDSFIRYQTKIIREYNRLAQEFAFEIINAERSPERIQKDLRLRIAALLGIPQMQVMENLSVPMTPRPGV
ncbi:MAG: thymidylate kinase [Armatimonadetes bacterium]|nr:thymidylate kinase [Armatimonadota bacterium]